MYQEGEYLVIQTYPLSLRLKVIKRTFDYEEAISAREYESLAHDAVCYGVRMYCEGKLWDLYSDGTPSDLSEEQFWEIHRNYESAASAGNGEGTLEMHHCTYPYYAMLMTCISCYGEQIECTQAITCLNDDHGRKVRDCPNCAGTLGSYFDEEEEYDDEEEETLTVPSCCQGCRNYNGSIYGGRQLICGMHPYGWDGDNCPDYQSNTIQELNEVSPSSAIVLRSQEQTEVSPLPILSITEASLVMMAKTEPLEKVISAEDDKNSQSVSEDVIQERLRQHHTKMRHMRFFSRIDSTLSATAGLCLLAAGLSAAATVAACGMGFIADGGVKAVQRVNWHNTAKVATGFGLVAGGGALLCGVLAVASSVIEIRTRP